MPHIVDRIEQLEGGILYVNRPGYYFGYGLESDPEAMDTLLGRSVTAELGVIAINRQLGVQEIDQVTDVPVEAFGGKSLQGIIAAKWKPYTNVPFSSYVLLESANRSDIVSGTLYEVGMDDVLRLNHWDLVTPPVRADDGGWSFIGWRYMDRTIELADGRKAESLTTYPEEPVDRVVNGTDYDPFLNGKDLTLRVIQDFTAEL